MTNVDVEVWSLSRMWSVPEGALSLQTTAGFTQRKDMQPRERMRRSDLHL